MGETNPNIRLGLWPMSGLTHHGSAVTVVFLARSGGLSKSTLSLFRHSDRFDFVFSLRCIDWVGKPLCEPNFSGRSYALVVYSSIRYGPSN